MNPSGLVESVVATGVVEAAVLVWFLVVAAFVGDLLVRRIVPRDAGTVERLMFSCGVGLGTLGLLTLLLGSLGLFHGWLFKGLFGVLSIYSVYCVIGVRMRVMPEVFREASERPGKTIRTLSWLAAALAIFSLGVGLVAALGPETEFDALNHHLGTVRLFLIAHGIVQTPSMAWAAHPLLVEMLYAFAWLAGNQLLAKLVHFGLGLLIALACYLFCRHYLSRAAGWLSAAVFVCSPIVLYLLQSAYIDLGLAFFGFLSVWAFYNWLNSRHTGWLVLSGVFCGFCLGVKYFGAVVPISLVGYWAWILLHARLRRGPANGGRFFAGLVRLAPFVAVSLLLLAPWLVKNLVLFGNPVAPFLADRISTDFLAAEDYRHLSALTSTWGGLEGGIVDYLRSPWLLTFKPEIFVGSIGPVFLLFLPLALVLGLRERVLRHIGFCALAQFVLIVAATRNVRYFVVILPLLSVLLAGGLFPSRTSSRRRCLAAAVVLAACIFQLPWFLHLWEDHPTLVVSPGKMRVFTSDEERRRQLDLWLGPGSARMYDFLDRNLPAGGRVLALTPVYQALTDRTVIMAPNSALSSRLSLQAVDAARVTAGLRIVQLEVGKDRAETGRFWRIRVPIVGDSGFEAVVRFFYRESMPLEIPVFDRREQSASGETMVLIDLGVKRRVDHVHVWLPEKPAAQSILLESSGGAGNLQDLQTWKRTPTTQKKLPERLLTRQDLIANMKNSRVLYVVVQDVAPLRFLLSFFEQGGAEKDFRRLAMIGNYRVYELSDTGGQ